MTRRTLSFVLSVLALASAGCGSGPSASADRPTAGPAAVTNLRCEYAVNPLGIDVVRPRLSWVIESSRRGEMQTAYRVLVASAAERLSADEGDLWDSGRVASDRSIQIEYAGKPLGSGVRAWWKVQAWDRDGKVLAWSAPAWWEAGLLNAEDWKARWISFPQEIAKGARPSLDGATWIWYPEGEPAKTAPAGDRYFRRTVELPRDLAVASAWLAIAADDAFELAVNGLPAARGNYRNQLYHFDLSLHLAPGPNLLAIAVHNAKGSAGLVARLRVDFATGDPLLVSTDKGWKAGNAAAPSWDAAAFDDAAWPEAQELVAFGQAPWEKTKTEGDVVPMGPVPFLRRAFPLSKPVKRARLYATALGIYELHINGQRVGRDLLCPGWTDYRKRVLVQAYDVTPLLRAGENALGAALAEGWYAGYIGWGGKRNHYGGVPALLAQLQVEYADGTSETVATDGTWTGATGPILGADLLMGETYDARRERPGWAAPGFDAAGWRPVQVREDVKENLVAQTGPTVQKMLEVPAKSMHEPRPGVYVFDLGQNMCGWVRLKAEGPAGTRVALRHAEMLNPDRTLYLTNLRSARATDLYVLKGKCEETWEPRFTFHGFRYVEVTGYPGRPPLDAVTGIVLYSATPPTGTFECSNPMINQLQSNIVWGQRGNFVSIPTDCPQRDERMGWMGDAQIFVRTACFNMDVAGFFTKWMDDVVDAQGATGAFYDVSPRYAGLAEGTPAWADAGVIVPWTIYLCYGDTRILERHYDAMAKWIEYVRSNNPDLVWTKKRGSDYGDWVSVLNSRTPKEVLATAFFAYSTKLMARTAKVLGKADDEKKYEALFGQIRDAFNKAFVAADGRVQGDTQTCYALPIRFGLLSPEHREAAGRYLVENVGKHEGRLTTGFLGVAHLLPALTETGHLDVAYRLFQNDVYPSWGYSIKRGATTIWERWDGWTEEKGFQDPGMNSFNHYSFGSVSEWMTTVVTGIEADAAKPGYKHLVLRPQPGGGITWAKASLDSMHGRIVSDWTLDGKRFAWKTIVPANTTATVHVPAANADVVKEGGKPAAQAEGVKFLKMEGGAAVYEVGAGSYAWETELP